jgi:hypothetical protein
VFIVARAKTPQKRAPKRRRNARQNAAETHAKTPQKRAPNHCEPVRESIEFHGECEHAAAAVGGGGSGGAAVLSRTNVMIIQAFVAIGVLRHIQRRTHASATHKGQPHLEDQSSSATKNLFQNLREVHTAALDINNNEF